MTRQSTSDPDLGKPSIPNCSLCGAEGNGLFSSDPELGLRPDHEMH